MADQSQNTAGNVRVTLRLPQAQVEMLDHINAYLGLGDRADVVRYLMIRGAEQIRVQQAMRDQADVLQKFTGVLSSELGSLAESVEKMEKPAEVLEFNAPEQKPEKKKTRGRKSSGPSSTGTKSQK